MARKSKNTEKYLEYNLNQIINDYTRVSDSRNTKTLIDHALTNNQNNMHCAINKIDHIGDHYLIEIKMNVQHKEIRLKEKHMITCWKGYKADKMKDMVDECEWKNLCINGVNEASCHQWSIN